MLDDHPSPPADEMNGDNPPYVRPALPKTKKAKPGAAQRTASGRAIFPSASERPCHRDYMHSFQVEGDKSDKWHRPGIYYHWVHEKTEKDGTVTCTPQDTWILSWLKVLAIVRTAAGREHGYLIEYLEHGEGVLKRLMLPQSALIGRADEAFRLLRSHGISVLNKNIKLAREYLDELHLQFSAAHPEDFWIQTKTVGWHSEKTFLLPNEIIGEKAGVCFNGNGEQALYGKKGSLKGWRDNVAALCTGNDYLMFALSSSFAGPLLKRFSIPGAGLHFHGDSSTGKTTAQYVGISSWASPGYMIPWSGTGNGLEGNAACRCDALIALDDLQQADQKVVATSVYMLINGMPKPRMNRDTTLKDHQVWRVFALSSGECSLETHLGSSAQTDHRAGQAMRLIDICAKARYGLFDDLHGCATGKLFAEKLLENCATHYGHAAPLFIKMLINKMPTLDLQARLNTIYQKFGEDLSAQEGRVARLFAVVALSGELAIEWEIVPLKNGSCPGWTADDAKNAALKIFEDWKKAQPQSSRSREHAQILKRVSDFIDVNASSRFLDINWKPGVSRYYGKEEEEPVVRDQAGYFEDNGTDRIFLFTSAGLKAATPGFDFARVLRALEEAGAFTVQGTDEKAKQRRTPDGRNPKLYHIDPAKLDPKP